MFSPFSKICVTASSSYSRGRQIIVQALSGAILTVRLLIYLPVGHIGFEVGVSKVGISCPSMVDFTRGGNYSAVPIGEFHEHGRRLALLQSGASSHSGAVSLASEKITSHRCCEWALLIGGLFLGR